MSEKAKSTEGSNSPTQTILTPKPKKSKPKIQRGLQVELGDPTVLLIAPHGVMGDDDRTDILWLRLVIEQQARKRWVRQTDAVLAEWLGTTRKTVLVYKRQLQELRYLNIDTSTRPQKLSVRYFPK